MGRGTAPPLAFEIVGDEQAFRSLAPGWRALFERARRPNHFQSFDWTWRSWEHIARARGQRLFVVVGRHAGRVVLICPFVRFPKAGLRTAEWIGGEESRYGDVLVEDAPEAAEWLEAAWSYVTQRLDFLWLNHMKGDAALVPFLRRVEGVARHVEAAPYVDWSDWSDWEAYRRSRTKNLRKDLSRRRRRLEEQGKVEFRVVSCPDETGETLDWMLAHKAQWLRNRGLRTEAGGIDSADALEFYRASVADARASGHLCLATLTLDGNVLAAELAFRCKGTVTGVLAAYDHAWENYAPGKLLMEDLLRWTLENDCAIYDFMPVGERYKYLWAPKEAEVTTYLVPVSLQGRALVAWRRSRPGAALRRLLRLRFADLPRIVRKRFSARSRG
ncbi:MAG: GNAT family N-acetyltransferase [Planctomycetota bacterium]